MRKWTLFVVASAFLAGVARADFTVTAMITQSGGYDIYTYQVVNNGFNGTGTNLLRVDVTLQAFSSSMGPFNTPNGHLILKTFDAQFNDPPVNDDLDVSNVTQAPSGDRSYIRGGTPTQWLIVSTTPGYESPDDSDPFAANKGPTPWGTDPSMSQTVTVPQFRVIGLVNRLTDGITDVTPKTFAVAVVPHGETVRAFGTFNSPEPSALGLLIPAVFGMLRRGRRF